MPDLSSDEEEEELEKEQDVAKEPVRRWLKCPRGGS